MRSRIFLKLLITLLVTLATVVLLLLFIVNWSFHKGFTDYIQQGELKKVESVVLLLQSQYQQHKSWQFIKHNRHRWKTVLETAGIETPPPPPRRNHRPPRRAGPHIPPDTQPSDFSDRPPKPEPKDMWGDRSPQALPLARPLAHRLALFSSDRKEIVDPGRPSKVSHWLPIEFNNATIGWLGLEAQQIESDELAHSFVEQQRQSYLIVAAAVLILSLLVAAVWGRFFLKPIHEVVNGAKKVAEGDYNSRVVVKGKDELAELAVNFNRMTEVLQRNETLRQQWISDISHELRTPIAVISGEIEALLDGVREPTQDRISSLFNDVQALSKLVEELHQLSLSDHGSLELFNEGVDLKKTLENLLVLMLPRWEEKGLSFTFDNNTNQNFHITGDQQRLTQLFTNLLENSLRYTDKGGETVIRLESLDKQIMFEVADTTPGVPDEALDRIFDRLYRVDKSRSRLVGGSGLGLSICKNIVEAHAGEIYAENRSGGGLKVTVLLPKK